MQTDKWITIKKISQSRDQNNLHLEFWQVKHFNSASVYVRNRIVLYKCPFIVEVFVGEQEFLVRLTYSIMFCETQTEELHAITLSEPNYKTLMDARIKM